MGAKPGARRLLAIFALTTALIAVTLVLIAGPGTRFGYWDFRFGLGLLGGAAIASVLGIGLSLWRLFIVGARAPGAIALVLSLAAVSVPIAFLIKARSVPAIHDITTDLSDPPGFRAVLAERGPGSNPPEYAGGEVAVKQRTAYPDLAPAILARPPEQVFARALDVARELQWDVKAAEAGEGRVEATATTFWFGFKDDVVVRIRAEGAGSRVDVRSKSRVGVSDLGANAARIREFLTRLQG